MVKVILATCCMIVLFCDCNMEQEAYYKQLNNNIRAFDSVNSYLIKRYAGFNKPKEGATLVIHPTEPMAVANNRLFDETIQAFCEEYSIYQIQITFNADNEQTDVIYSLDDSNYNYSYSSKENDGIVFENTRVLVRPVNKHWQFVHEKPNF